MRGKGWVDGKGRTRALILCVLCVLCGGVGVFAQFQMPDPKMMSGIPRPVDDLPSGSISVRLIRGDLANNIAGHPVELHIGDKVQTVKTDEAGRAQFDKVPAGTKVQAVAVVDGERLESQEFAAPAQGGIRLMLVATDKEKEARAAAEAKAPAIQGQVVIGGESRIVIEPGDESVQVYYLLDIENTARTPVNTASPFMFDMPSGALGTSLLEDSSSRSSVNGGRVRVEGPFPPGHTMLQVACDLPVSGSGTIEITQRFPAAFQQLGILVKKVGNMRLTSPQITRQQDMPAQGDTYIAAAGDTLPAGQPLTLVLSGLPYHSLVPQRIALVLAALIAIAGVWFAGRTSGAKGAQRTERRRLIERRDKLFHDLVRLETDRRHGRGDASKYAARREQLMRALEQVYGALDTDETHPDPADRSSLAA